MAKALKCSARAAPMPRIHDLADHARQSGYRVGIMADQLGHSSRWLELFCHKEFALTPHAWLARLRQHEIQQLARTGTLAKVICHLVGFANTASFSHSFKRFSGRTFRQVRNSNRQAISQKSNFKESPQIARANKMLLVQNCPLEPMDEKDRGAWKMRTIEQARL